MSAARGAARRPSCVQAERRDERGRSRRAPSRSKCSRRIRVEVEVELGHGRLHHAPHRLAEVGHEAHELERLARLPRGHRRSTPRAALALRRVELVIDREVREVEEAVTHPRVLPVDDAEALAIVQEVRVQEIVVARDGRVGRASLLDPRGDLVRADRTPRARFLRGRALSAGTSRPRGRSRTPGISGPSWNARSAAATRSSVAGSRIRSSAGSLPRRTA